MSSVRSRAAQLRDTGTSQLKLPQLAAPPWCAVWVRSLIFDKTKCSGIQALDISDLQLDWKMGDENYDFGGADAGASATFPMQCSALRKGGFVMIKVGLTQSAKVKELPGRVYRHLFANIFVFIYLFPNYRTAPARLSRCPPLKPESTATLKSILLLLIFSQVGCYLVRKCHRTHLTVFYNLSFPGKKLEDICPSTHNMEVPNVKRKDYQLIGMDDDFLSLMDDSGDTRDDLKCPAEDSDVGKEVRDAISNEADILVRTVEIYGGSVWMNKYECGFFWNVFLNTSLHRTQLIASTNIDTLFSDCTEMIRNLKCSEIVIDALVQAGSEFLKK